MEDSTNRVINKQAIASSGMAWLYKKMKDWDSKLSRIDDELNLRVIQWVLKKVKKDEFSKKFKKTKKKLRDEIDDKEKR